MSHSQNSEPKPEEANGTLASTVVGQLGHIGLHEDDELTPSIDIRVEAIDSPHFAPAGARPYEGTAKRGLTIYDSPSQATEAAAYARTVFPESNFTSLGNGRYGIVLADETGKAYKVYRDALHYSRYEKEAGALRMLSDVGLAPRLHLFVDAGEQYRLDRKAYDYTTFGFEDVQIPRQSSGKELPVMVMDKVDVEPLENAEPSKLIDGFCKAAEVFIKENIISWDTEVMVNKATGSIVILDVGELSQKPFDKSSATPQTQMDHDSEILRGLALDFGLSQNTYQIQAIYREGGLGAVRDFLVPLLNKS
jgi:hypothetical protein